MPLTVIIRGPLGSGKTTIAKQVARELKGRYVSVDTILEKEGLDTIEDGCIPERNFLRVNAIILEKWKNEKRPIIVDGCFYHKRALEGLVRATGALVFTLKLPVEICVERDRKRKGGLGEKACREVYRLVGRFDYGMPIDAERPVGENVRKIVSVVQKTGGGIDWRGAREAF